MKILISIAYDGSNYFGWQRQKDKITIQEQLEKTLTKVFNKDISIIGCSRTDAKVHALNQKATFDINFSPIPINKIATVLTNNLPKDIVVNNSSLVDDDFHVRYNAKKKIYKYSILNSNFNNPLLRNYCYHFIPKINISLIQEASKFIIGTHDFKSFCASNTDIKNTKRTIYSFDIKQEENQLLTFTICGNGFLYNMVRIIVGTLIEIGAFKRLPEDLLTILNKRERRFAGRTVPAHGLTLKNIIY